MPKEIQITLPAFSDLAGMPPTECPIKFYCRQILIYKREERGRAIAENPDLIHDYGRTFFTVEGWELVEKARELENAGQMVQAQELVSQAKGLGENSRVGLPAETCFNANHEDCALLSIVRKEWKNFPDASDLEAPPTA